MSKKTKRADTKLRQDDNTRSDFVFEAHAQHKAHGGVGAFGSWRLCKNEQCRDNQREYEERFVTHGKES